MRWWLMLALLAALPSASYGMERCYTSEIDWTETIIDDGTDYGPLVKRSLGKTTVMSTMGAGTGLQFRVAIEEDGTTHHYRYVGHLLIMDMNAYSLGCLGRGTWTDRTCSRVLISQLDPYAGTPTFYFVEPDHPITSCLLPVPFKERLVADLQCFSGKTLHMDASDYPTLVVDGVEMQLFGEVLPCRGRGETSP
jgi:hypothetical protein